MRLLHINQFQGIGSTGRIMDELCTLASENGFDCYKACAFSLIRDANTFITERMQPYYGARKNLLKSRIIGLNGYSSKNNTKRLLKWIDDVSPDLIHLHNIHGNWVNLEMFFTFLSDKKIPVVWTLHDTWSFTGRCAILKEPVCDKWIAGCSCCPHKDAYPSSYFFDFSKRMWLDKKEWTGLLNNLTIVSPSKWLDSLVAQSFLNVHRHIVINNGIDIDVFHPISSLSPYLQDLKGKKIVLGVASSWSNDKGLGDFVQLSSIIDHDKYHIVLVGVDERRKKHLPSSILCINHTNNVEELAHLYSCADVFVNPTYADNYPTVNMEALACGTPVITYKTGGSPESIEGNTGMIVKLGDLDALWRAIQSVCDNHDVFNACRSSALAGFDKKKNYSIYINLYKQILGI